MTDPVTRVMVVGASGMLGHRVARHFARSRDTVALLREGNRPPRLVQALAGARVVETGPLDGDAIAALLDHYRPELVINAAGLIKQRPEASDPVAMIEANALLPHRLAAHCSTRAVRLIHISSDCVFNGCRGHYREEDPTDANDLYGRTKRLGEPAGHGVLTMRTSIIGPEVGTAYGLLEWFRARQRTTANGYRRVIFPGLPTIRVAMLLETVADRFPLLDGLYHVGAEPIAKHDLLSLINDRYGFQITLRPVDEPASDRSLDCSRFRLATGFVAESWPELVDLMASNEEDERKPE